MKLIRKRLTYSNVMSSIAVFLVLGGATAFAASQLGKNSVGTKQLKKNAVTTAKIKNNAVTTNKIKNGAVSGAKVNLSSLGKVPSAATADTATSAGNANTVNGQAAAKIFTKLPDGGGTTTIATIAGFTLTASCPHLGGNEVVVTLNSPTNVPSVLTGIQSSGGTTAYTAGTNVSIDLDNDSFGEASFSGATTTGTVISGNLGFDYPTTFSSEDVCAVYGEVFSG